jgi:signal transduction histidine kinase
MKRLVTAVQELSHARTVEAIQVIVRRAARELTGCDGATFVLRDNGQCYYADEDAISPLWKGQRFPLSACISGWAMLNKQPAIIEDIYADDRIPADAYRPTFVKSLVMVPIRAQDPIGAIGNYWAHPHQATPEEVEVLQALANTTAVAMESARLYAELEQRVQDRTLQLQCANRELEAFSYSVSHDLQAPIRAISGFTQIIAEESSVQLSEKGTRYFGKILSETRRMSDLITDLLRLARFARVELQQTTVDLRPIAGEITTSLASTPVHRHPDQAEHSIEFRIGELPTVRGDAGLLRVVLVNLLSNAWKYSSRRDHALVEFDTQIEPDGSTVYFVRDNGTGFDMAYASNLFAPFQRLHRREDFEGTGVGLATVQRIIHRHGGRLWAESAVDQGATFFFTLPAASSGFPLLPPD